MESNERKGIWRQHIQLSVRNVVRDDCLSRAPYLNLHREDTLLTIPALQHIPLCIPHNGANAVNLNHHLWFNLINVQLSR